MISHGEEQTLGCACRARFDVDAGLLEQLSDHDAEALRAVIGADDTIELVRKVHRLAAATIDPVHVLGHMPAMSAGFMTFCLELSAYRRFMERLATGARKPRELATEIEREDRQWLLTVLHERFGGPPPQALLELMQASERWSMPIDEAIRRLRALGDDPARSAEHDPDATGDRKTPGSE